MPTLAEQLLMIAKKGGNAEALKLAAEFITFEKENTNAKITHAGNK